MKYILKLLIDGRHTRCKRNLGRYAASLFFVFFLSLVRRLLLLDLCQKAIVSYLTFHPLPRGQNEYRVINTGTTSSQFVAHPPSVCLSILFDKFEKQFYVLTTASMYMTVDVKDDLDYPNFHMERQCDTASCFQLLSNFQLQTIFRVMGSKAVYKSESNYGRYIVKMLSASYQFEGFSRSSFKA